MVEVGITEAQSTLVALVRQVEQGQEVIIVRDGNPVARLVPNQAQPIVWTEEQKAASRAASERIRERAKTLPKVPFDWEEIKKDLGRKWE